LAKQMVPKEVSGLFSWFFFNQFFEWF
jgi:hypothetical protein